MKGLHQGERLLLLVNRSGISKNEVDYSGDTEPPPTYTDLEQMSALEVMRYLEEKDNRHYQERSRLLAIIENLTKK